MTSAPKPAAIAAITILTLAALSSRPAAAPAAGQPRLIVLAVVDQMRFDYLSHYDSKISAGFRRLLTGGAVFTAAYYPYASTETAQGHATMVSGQSPSVSGMVGDSWYDRQTRTTISAGASVDHKLLDGTPRGGSPEQLLVHTVGDAMKQHDRRTIVVAEAWKRYSAVLMGGQHADAAYWFDTALGNMVTSDYYLPAYPAWVDIFNKRDPTAAFFGRPWLGHQLSTKSKPDAAYRDALRGTTYTNDVQLDFTAALLTNTQLGRDDVPDFLGVSFSAMDQIGHVYGPDTPEMDEMVVQMDRQLGVLMRMLDERVGPGNWTMALVSDHGAAELPEKVKARGEDAGRMDIPKFKAAVVKELSATYSGADRLISAFEAPEFYLDYAEGERQGADAATLERAVARAALKQPGIARVYTRNQILAAGPTSDEFLRAIANGFHPGRSGDIYMVVKPNYFLWGEKGTHHGTPYEYDQHVPLIFYGAGIAKRTDTDRVLINDLAPTLAAIAGTTMHGLPGRILTSALGEPQ